MTREHESAAERDARRAAQLERLHERTERSEDAGGGRRPDRDRAKRFSGPIGLNDDGSPQRELSEAERRHNADIRAGRKRPGSAIEDPPDRD
ncbi:hypothetical protein [Glycomyces terrestris]|uniref:Uncharacterized protein n=1 Tax=Glycomyces terrestris TaxID=2493553 RepID=A0A426V3E6_9ACTN|nr:hypothetical protein [Glycomyces terrestris]RRS01375.1 hypothetical protein EIW28_00950 [Glycomyces terrestris]